MNTTLYQNRPEDTLNWTKIYLEPHDHRIYYVNIDLRHQYGISAPESQTFLRAKRPQLRRARRNGCFRRLLLWLTALFSSYRRSSENIANNPLPPLPDDMEDQFDPESEERQQMLKPEIYGGLSGSEGDIELEEFHGNEQAVALEMTPIAHSKEKAGNSKKKTTIV